MFPCGPEPSAFAYFSGFVNDFCKDLTGKERSLHQPLKLEFLERQTETYTISYAFHSKLPECAF
jgi:hypothetical protein